MNNKVKEISDYIDKLELENVMLKSDLAKRINRLQIVGDTLERAIKDIDNLLTEPQRFRLPNKVIDITIPNRCLPEIKEDLDVLKQWIRGENEL